MNKEEQSIFLSAKTGATMLVAIICACFWNLVSLPLFFILPDEIASGNKLAAIGYIFPAIGLLLIALAVYTVFFRRKYGIPQLCISQQTLALGSMQHATAYIRARIHPEEPIRCLLKCTKTTTTGSGKQKNTIVRTLWSAATTISHDTTSYQEHETHIPIELAIPFDMPATCDSDNLEWTLELSAPTTGIDFKALFELPVTKTETSNPQIDSSTINTAILGQSNDEAIQSLFKDEKIERVQHSDNVTRIHTPPFRHIGVAFLLTLTGLVFSGAGGAAFYTEKSYFFSLIFVAIGLICIYAAINNLLTTDLVESTPEKITHRSGWLIPWRKTIFPRSEIKSIHKKDGMQSGQTIHNRICLKTHAHKEHILLRGILETKVVQTILNDLMPDTADKKQ